MTSPFTSASGEGDDLGRAADHNPQRAFPKCFFTFATI